jgi:hypothetical protein
MAAGDGTLAIVEHDRDVLRVAARRVAGS